MKFLKILTAVLFIGSLAPVATATDLAFPLYQRNELFRITEEIRPYLYDSKVLARLNKWLTHPKNNAYIVECQFHMRAYFRSPKIIGPLCYFLRQDGDKRKGYFAFVKRYELEVGAALLELSNDPRYSNSDRNKAKGWYQAFTENHDAKIKECFAPALRTNYPDSGELNYSPFNQVGRCFRDSLPKNGGVPYFAVNLAKEFSNHPGHAITPTGWVGGNEVTYLGWNPNTQQDANTVAERHAQMTRHYPLDGAGSYESFRRADLSQVFTAEQGFYTIDTDPIWTAGADRDDATFPAIKKAIDSAQETIFIDIFFLGSSMGVSLAKHLIDRAESGIKVLILRDNYNHFGHEPEMLPVYNFLRAYMYKNPDKLVISGSYIKKHETGLPRFMDNILTDEFIEKSGLQEHLSLYARAVSDHSKVFVIDGKTQNPLTLVGSKNLTDAAGAVVFDEVVQAKGPIAAVVQDDYYYDMAYALRYEMKDDMLRHVAQNGWAKNAYRSGQSDEEMVANILAPFDLLGRDGDLKVSSPGQVMVRDVGNSLVRSGYNNVDSTRTNAIDQKIQAIRFARRNIYIKDQFLFDANVVLALINAKKRNSGLDIKVLLDPANGGNPKGLPNLLYLDLLKAAGIDIRWKTVTQLAGKVEQKYHMKTLSVDGRFVISGSANKDRTTMYGSFREAQLDVDDAGATRAHDEIMLEHWANASQPFNGFDFQVPHNLKGLNGQPMSPQQYIALLRNVASILFDATRM